MRIALSIRPTPSLRPKRCYKPRTLKIKAILETGRDDVSNSPTHVGTQKSIDPKRQGFDDQSFDQIQSSLVKKNVPTS